MRRRIYLMRHGQVAYFPDPEVPVDPAYVVLTAEGQEQARASGSALAGVRFDRVVTSGLPRTTRTAELVLGELAHPPEAVVHDPDLQEFRPGDIDLVSDEDLEEEFLQAWRESAPPEATFLRGETVGSLTARVAAAMQRLYDDRSWNTLLIVAHGGVNRAIVSSALAGPGTFFGQLEQAPACINIIDIEPGYVVRAVNVTPYDPLHSGPRITTLEDMLEQCRAMRAASVRISRPFD